MLYQGVEPLHWEEATAINSRGRTGGSLGSGTCPEDDVHQAQIEVVVGDGWRKSGRIKGDR